MSVPNAGPRAGSLSVEAHDPQPAASTGQPSTKPSNSSFFTAGSQPLADDKKRSSEPLNSTDPEYGVATADEEDGDHPIAPDQFDPKYETSKWEIWSYYAYYIGNNGLTLFNFAPTAFQDLLYLQAGDAEVLNFLGSNRTINSIVLLSNGISFAIQVVLFLAIGSLADYGSWRPYILIFWSIIAFGLGFGWLGVHHPEQWPTATGLYMIGLIAYQMCFTFWFAAFPGLARNTKEMRLKAEEYEGGKIDRDEYDYEDMMQRNRISNVAFIMQSAGEVLILAVLVGILKALKVEKSDQNNLWGLSVLIAYATACWVVLAIPWFIMEKRRPGQKVPPGMNLVSVGFWTIWRAMTQIYKLKQSLLYLIGESTPMSRGEWSTDTSPGFFVLSDSLNTTVTVIATLQNSVVAYNTLTLTYLLIVGIAAQGAGIFIFWTIQKRFKLSTKVMFDAVMLGIVLLDGWGMIGIWTHKVSLIPILLLNFHFANMT